MIASKTLLINAPIVLHCLEMTKQKVTDTIPRAGVFQILQVLAFIASTQKTTFEQIRLRLLTRSNKRAPASRWALGTVVRDVLIDLQKLGLIETGVLPRKAEMADRYGQTPCAVTEKGRALAELSQLSKGRALDQIMLEWIGHHPYFRILMERLCGSALYVPDVTSLKQIGVDASSNEPLEVVASRISDNCLKRLAPADFPQVKAGIFSRAVRDRTNHLREALSLSDLDTKRWVDTVQDKVVLPAFLEAEDLPFDPVTFQHLLKIGRDFYAASWTTSHPDYALRVIFLTCEFRPQLAMQSGGLVAEVKHHGKTFIRPSFVQAFKAAYRRLEKSLGAYIDAYKVRALVCVELGIQPSVFASCLNDLIEAGPTSDLTIYTELPFESPPHGEDYLEIDRNRIGLIKLTF
jgi:hypothetical protein